MVALPTRAASLPVQCSCLLWRLHSQVELKGIWFLARPLVLDAARVKENRFPLSFIGSILPGRAKVVKKIIVAFFWQFWLNPDGVGSWQGPNSQAMCEKWRGSAVGRARTGRWQAAARLQIALEESSSQLVSAFSESGVNVECSKMWSSCGKRP